MKSNAKIFLGLWSALWVLHMGVSSNNPPAEMFRAECHSRHFVLLLKPKFLSRLLHFSVGGEPLLSSHRATECGCAIVLSSSGDLQLRVSFWGCHVRQQRFPELQLQAGLVLRNRDGHEDNIPILLSCPMQQPWSRRELVCEESYMEASVHRNTLPPRNWTDDFSSRYFPEVEPGDWKLVIHRLGNATRQSLSLIEARQLGCYISTTASRIILRCSYSSQLAHTVQVQGIEVEVVSASLLYWHKWVPLLADMSVACTLKRAVMDGKHVQWVFPQILSPLVSGWFRDGGVRMGVGIHLLSECMSIQRGYEIGAREGIVEVRIPFGAEGGHVKSAVVDERFVQSFSVDTFFLQQWEDAQWGLTQYRTFRALSTPLLLHTPMLTNQTVPAAEMFSVTLGVFPPEVFLRGISVGGESLSSIHSHLKDIRVSQIPSGSKDHSYLLQAAFSHPLVYQELIGGNYRRYRLEVTFDLEVSPSGSLYRHHSSIMCDVGDVVWPQLEGKCTDEGVLVLLQYGNVDSQWELFLSGQRMDEKLVQLGGYRLNRTEEYFSVELPLYSPGMVIEMLSLNGLEVQVDVSLVNVDTLKVDQTFIQHCTFYVDELVVCHPDGWIVASVNTSRIDASVEPKYTTLLDPNCRPIDTEAKRALFRYSLNSCGTRKKVEGDHLVFENEVNHPAFHVRAVLQCRYLRDEMSLAAGGRIGKGKNIVYISSTTGETPLH